MLSVRLSALLSDLFWDWLSDLLWDLLSDLVSDLVSALAAGADSGVPFDHRPQAFGLGKHVRPPSGAEQERTQRLGRRRMG